MLKMQKCQLVGLSVALLLAASGCDNDGEGVATFIPGPNFTPGATAIDPAGSGVGTDPGVAIDPLKDIGTPLGAPTVGPVNTPGAVPIDIDDNLGIPIGVPTPPPPPPTPTPSPTPTPPNAPPVLAGAQFIALATGVPAAVEGNGSAATPYVFIGSTLPTLPANANCAFEPIDPNCQDVPDANQPPIGIFLTFDDPNDVFDDSLTITVENGVFIDQAGNQLPLPAGVVVPVEASIPDPPGQAVFTYNPDTVGTYVFQIIATDDFGAETVVFFTFGETDTVIPAGGGGTPGLPPAPSPTPALPAIGDCVISADPADPDPGQNYTPIVTTTNPALFGQDITGDVDGTDGFMATISGTFDDMGMASLSPQIPGAVEGVVDTITLTAPDACIGSAELTF